MTPVHKFRITFETPILILHFPSSRLKAVIKAGGLATPDEGGHDARLSVLQLKWE